LKHERATEELRELAALYALGSLTQQEARSFEVHLSEGCSICEFELRRFQHAAAGIGIAAAEIAAPDYIRDLLSARMQRESQSSAPVVQPTHIEKEKPVEELQEPEPAPSPVPFSFSSQHKRSTPAVFPWILVVILAVIAIVAFFSWRSEQEINAHLQARASAAQADTVRIQGELTIQREAIGYLGKILDSVGKPGVRIARLVVNATPAESSAALIWDTEKEQCLVMGSFPPEPAGKKYQLWFFGRSGEKVSAGLLRINPTGRTFLDLPVPKEAAGAAAAVVTLEPDNGSQIPTLPYFATGRLD
jgi:anti-sigma-K factor RskA